MAEPIDTVKRSLIRKRSPEMNMLDYGKLPPQVKELEEAVLGAIMIENDALEEVIQILNEECFYVDAHQRIWKAIRMIYDRSDPIDLLTVTEQLKKNGELDAVGGPFYIAQLTNKVGSAANIEYHSRLIQEKHIARKTISVCSEAIKNAYEDDTDVFDLVDNLGANISDISEVGGKGQSYTSMGSGVNRALKELDARMTNSAHITGVETGFAEMNQTTGGWQKTDLVIIAARPAMGKCVAKNTNIIMYDGSLKMVQDIVVDDLIMGVDSMPRKVLSLARGREMMYWVKQKFAMDYRVNESHILSLKRSRNEWKHKHGDILNIELREYIGKSNKFKTNYKGWKTEIDFQSKPLIVDPYFLGIWLGDGEKNTQRVHKPDPEIRDFIKKYASQIGLGFTESDGILRCASYNIVRTDTGSNPLRDKLRELNVIDNKHIPNDFLINSKENRLQLLAGLLDTDGHYNAEFNVYEITMVDESIMKQIKYLCDTLGFRTNLTPKKATIKSIGYECMAYRVRIYGNLEIIPCKIGRKKARKYIAKRSWRHTSFKIEQDKVDDYYGFTLDQDGLFLLEDGTVTHNTSLLLSLANNAAMIGEKITPVGIFSMEMSTEQLVMRNIAMETGVSSEKLRKGDLRNDEYHRLTSGLDRLNLAPIYIDDTPALSLFELKTKARTMVKKNGVGIIFIDYLQLMSGSGARSEGNREQEISSISRGIKGLAKELKIPIIALSQLSRAVETRQGDKKPMLSDLRESGCITGDSLIYNADDGIYYPIKDMVGKTFSTNSVNEDKKIDIDFVDSVFESGYKDVFELKLSSGGTIRATDNHQFLTFSGWKELRDILAGEYLAIPKKLSINSTENNLTDEEIILHAHLLGDGSILPRQPYRYSNSCEDSCEIVKEAAQKQFNISCREEWSGGCRVLFFTSPIHLTHNVKHPISLFYDKIGIERDRAHLKVVSNMIFLLTNDKIAMFISHIWATDGCICKDKKGTISITYSSTSEKLIDQLRILLLRMDIYSNKSRGKKDGYRDTFYVSISDAINQYKFCETIPLFGEKLRHYKKVEDELNRIVQTSNPNKDVIPKQCWDTIRKICSDKHIPQRQFQAGIGGHYCGTALYKRNIGRKRLNKIADFLNSDELKQIAASDVLWDTVESIKYIGKETVYDATVRNNHNFIANNIVVHNSLEQDADIVIFLYRGEYYGFDTDADGNSTKGMADIIIAKHRNGPLKDVKVRFIGERTKFEDLNMTVSETGHLEPTQEKSQWKSMGERAKQYADKPVAELPPGTSQEIAPYKPEDNTGYEGGHGSFGDEDAPF